MPRATLPAMLLAAGVLLPFAPSANSEEVFAPYRQPVVIELFTSQGCSSCPPANANLIVLAERPNVLALSFSVTYWDYLGWKDPFGRPEYTQRQEIYEPKLGERGPFTPQMVVDGRASAIGFSLRQMDDLVAANPRKTGPSISLADDHVGIGPAKPRAQAADIWLVWYDPNIVEVPVRRGENSGRTLRHSHVVRNLVRLGDWSGRAATFKMLAAPEGLKTAVLVQESQGGPILAAATD
ncbi:MAG: DUF1223 domain-containing protein [Xanthobacteraceae bacterium]